MQDNLVAFHINESQLNGRKVQRFLRLFLWFSINSTLLRLKGENVEFCSISR